MSDTPLSRMLSESETRRPDALTAFRLARKRFLSSDRVEMREIAADLGVSRTTLFRWVGSRDDLLVEICWSIAKPTLQHATAAADDLVGGDRIASIAEAFARSSIDAPFYREFLRREPERALRLNTTAASPFQERVIDHFASVIQEEVDACRLTSTLEVADLAYLVVRLLQSYAYADVIAGESPEPDKVRRSVSGFLRD